MQLGGDGTVLTTSLEDGVRHDGGDAETGFGLDLGIGLALGGAERRPDQAELRLGVEASRLVARVGGGGTVLTREPRFLGVAP